MSASRHVRGSVAGWRIVVEREFQSCGAANVKERLPVSSLTDGLWIVTAEDERVERDDWIFSFRFRYEGLLCWRAVYVRDMILYALRCFILSQ